MNIDGYVCLFWEKYIGYESMHACSSLFIFMIDANEELLSNSDTSSRCTTHLSKLNNSMPKKLILWEN